MAERVKKETIDPEQLARIEATMRELELTGQRFMMQAATLRRQVDALKNGPARPKKKITDWSSFTKDW